MAEDVLTEAGLGPIVSNRFGERYFYNVNRNSFVKTSSQTLFDSKFSNNLFIENTLHVVVGTDSGLLPNYVQNTKLPKGSRYIFIEPEAVLQALTAQQMLNDLDAERIVCICQAEWEETITRFKIKEYFYINAVQSFNAFCAENDYLQIYAEISWHITEVLSKLHWINSLELGSESFITRQLENIADNVLPAQLLAKAFTNKTVVLLAGGPSLDQALPWVKKNKNKIVVFAVSRISRQLLQADIAPDFVFSVDPTELSFDVSKEMLNFGEQTAFICSHHAVPLLVNQWPNKLFYLGPRVPWPSVLNVENISSAGPTVTNTAINVAYYLGFKTIIVAGLDLCFTREGYTHAKGSNEDLAGPRFNLTSLQVETYDGYLAPTSCDFAQAMASLQIQAEFLVENGCKVINLSGQAAKVANIAYQAADTIELDSEAINVVDLIRPLLKQQIDDPRAFDQVLQELNRARFQIHTIAKLAEQARKINSDMYNERGVIENYKDKKQLDKIEKKFKREYRKFAKLVKVYGIRRFIRLAKPFTDEEWDAKEAKELGNIFYDAYQEGAAKLLQVIDQAIERTLVRQQEFTNNPNFQQLIAQAEKDQSYGRVRIWLRKFPNAMLSEAVANTFAEFEQRFVNILAEKNTEHFATTQKQSSLTILKQRGALLLKHKKIEELQSLKSGLDKHQQQEEAIPYHYLLNAYLAELQNDYPLALTEYEKIVAAGDQLLEEALTRIAFISTELENEASALLALQCLSQINPVYLPFYAEMLRLQGNYLPAIDAYHRYIAQFPDDTVTQLKLVMFYIEAKIYDGAELLVNYLLQKSPDMEMALLVKNQLQVLKLKAG